MDFSSKKPSEVKFSANAVFSNRRPIKIYGVENWTPRVRNLDMMK